MDKRFPVSVTYIHRLGPGSSPGTELYFVSSSVDGDSDDDVSGDADNDCQFAEHSKHLCLK